MSRTYNRKALSLVAGLGIICLAGTMGSRAARSDDRDAAGERPVISGEHATAIDRYLSTLTDSGFSGTVLLARDGQVVLHKGYGSADDTQRNPVTTGTVFDIGSITKQFTAAAIMKLEMAGKLNTSDLLSQHQPDVPPDNSAITLHHLLTHTAGLVMYSGGDYDVSLRDETVTRILGTPLESKPGEKFSYSNPGYSLLAAIIERVSNEPYEAFLRKNLFDPAGMRSTGYRLATWDVSQVARGYMDEKNGRTPPDYQWGESGPYWNLFGNGGMLSTTADLYKWAQALKGEQLLSADAKRKLFAPS